MGLSRAEMVRNTCFQSNIVSVTYVRMFHSLGGLVSFQRIWLNISRVFGMLFNIEEIQNTTNENIGLKVRTLEDAFC